MSYSVQSTQFLIYSRHVIVQFDEGAATFLKVFFEAFHLKQERTETNKHQITTRTSGKPCKKHHRTLQNYRNSPVFICGVCNLYDIAQTDLRENLGVDNQLVICLKEEFTEN